MCYFAPIEEKVFIIQRLKKFTPGSQNPEKVEFALQIK